jgi:hypothetical protein
MNIYKLLILHNEIRLFEVEIYELYKTEKVELNAKRTNKITFSVYTEIIDLNLEKSVAHGF